MTALRHACLFVVALFCALALSPTIAAADETDALFAAANAALADGLVGDAIVDFEALADRGVVDPSMSFDRGLAYAARVNIGSEQPGDLGRAAQGFEEARALTSDSKLIASATGALSVIRAEVARRRARAGDSTDVEQVIIGRAIVRLLSEDTWCIAASVASIALGASLFVRALSASRQGKAGGAIGWAVSTPILVFCAVMALLAREDRMHLREAVIVSAGARAADDKGIVLDNLKGLPEAALVEVVGTKPGWSHVKWGPMDGWIPSATIRSIARAD